MSESIKMYLLMTALLTSRLGVTQIPAAAVVISAAVPAR
jgi:hypothetical protein